MRLKKKVWRKKSGCLPFVSVSTVQYTQCVDQNKQQQNTVIHNMGHGASNASNVCSIALQQHHQCIHSGRISLQSKASSLHPSILCQQTKNGGKSLFFPGGGRREDIEWSKQHLILTQPSFSFSNKPWELALCSTPFFLAANSSTHSWLACEAAKGHCSQPTNPLVLFSIPSADNSRLSVIFSPPRHKNYLIPTFHPKLAPHICDRLLSVTSVGHLPHSSFPPRYFSLHCSAQPQDTFQALTFISQFSLLLFFIFLFFFATQQPASILYAHTNHEVTPNH